MAKKPAKLRVKKAPPALRAPSKAKAKIAAKPKARAEQVPKPVKIKAPKQPEREVLDDFIDAAAATLQLPVEPAWRSAIKTNLAITLRMGEQVSELALPDETEPAPVFEA